MSEPSVKPYLIRALFDWCNDSGFTPYLTVQAGDDVQVPREHVRDGEIILNISPLATNRLLIGNDEISFQARFGGVAREVRVPIESVRSIYARENGQGMAFEPATEGEAANPETVTGTSAQDADAGKEEAPPPVRAPILSLRPVGRDDVPPSDTPPPAPTGGDRPRLTRVK